MELVSLGSQLAAVVAAASPSVVRVDARRRLGATGVVWAPDLVVTADHAVLRDDRITVAGADHSPHPATLVGRDPTTDLALLRVDDAPFTAPTWVGLDEVAVGHFVVALGRPGRTVRASFGIVGVLGDAFKTGPGAKVEAYLEPMLYLPPGFSGGPLFDVQGRVVGVNTAGLVRGETLAVPTTTVRRVVEDLLADGRPRRGWLGVGTSPARLADGRRGLVVVGVADGGPAAQAGVLVGDVLVEVDGTPVQSAEDLLDRLGGGSVGSTVQLGVLRGGAANTLAVVVGVRGAA